MPRSKDQEVPVSKVSKRTKPKARSKPTGAKPRRANASSRARHSTRSGTLKTGGSGTAAVHPEFDAARILDEQMSRYSHLGAEETHVALQASVDAAGFVFEALDENG